MHDPMTVAFEIKSPFFKYKPWPKRARRDPNPWRLKRGWQEMTEAQKAKCSQMSPDGYRETLITIWHVDPQRDGSDDSCGYSFVKLTKAQVERLRNAAWHEGRDPHFLCCPQKEWSGSCAEAESLSRGLFLFVCRSLAIDATFEQAAKYASEATHIRDCIKFGHQFCFIPGYHTNSQKDSAEDRQEHFHGILCGVARLILTQRRPWWKHPKWHVWHWRIQWRFWQKVHRYLFQRCAICGRRFTKFGDSNVIGDWAGTRVWHPECDRTIANKLSN